MATVSEDLLRCTEEQVNAYREEDWATQARLAVHLMRFNSDLLIGIRLYDLITALHRAWRVNIYLGQVYSPEADATFRTILTIWHSAAQNRLPSIQQLREDHGESRIAADYVQRYEEVSQLLEQWHRPTEGKRLIQYLHSIIGPQEESKISASLADSAMRVWLALQEVTHGQVPVPSACTTGDGRVIFSWDRAEHHFEVEFIPSHPIEFFYRNRLTKELWDAELTEEQELPDELINKLKLVCARQSGPISLTLALAVN